MTPEQQAAWDKYFRSNHDRRIVSLEDWLAGWPTVRRVIERAGV